MNELRVRDSSSSLSIDESIQGLPRVITSSDEVKLASLENATQYLRRIASFFDDSSTIRVKLTSETSGHRRAIRNTLRAAIQTLKPNDDMKQAVRLPAGEVLNEWIALHTIIFFEAACRVYALSTEFCTVESCPVMSLGNRYHYMWSDPKQRKNVSMPASVYVEAFFQWADECISDQSLFPIEDGASFPASFPKAVRDIFRRLFRVYGHIYYHHWSEMQEMGVVVHINSSFKHFILFCIEHSLLEEKDMLPLDKLIQKLRSEE